MKRLKQTQSPQFSLPPAPAKPKSVTAVTDAEGRRWVIDQDGLAVSHTKTGFWLKLWPDGPAKFTRLL